jgi:hypothetical protein
MNELTEANKFSSVSPDDLQTYKHFLQLFIQQQEVLGQIQRYLGVKYNLKSMEQINIETGEITQL